MRYVSTFSGVEAATVAWGPLGWEASAFAETDPFCRAVLAERFPSVPNLGDVTEVDWTRYRGKADLVVGGSPCQSFSVAGKREGLDGESGLMWEYVRCVREVRPRWLVWENVPGALTSGGGEDFRCLLAALGDLGYCVSWRVLDAQFFGVAQRRRRLFAVGSLGDGRSADVLFERGCLRGDPPSSREKRQELARAAGSRPAGACWGIAGNVVGRADSNGGHQLGVADPDEDGMFTVTATDRHAVACGFSAGQSAKAGSIAFREEQAPTLRAGASGTNQVPTVMVADGARVDVVRRLTPRECERLQGFPDDWTRIPWRGKPAGECPDAPRYRAMGNSMAVPVMRWIGERIDKAERGML